MRPTVRPEGALEQAGLRLNLGPWPVPLALFGMPMARAVTTAQRMGLFARLAREPATVDELVAEESLNVEGTRLLLQTLVALDLLSEDGGRYSLDRKARKWLDPASDTNVGAFIDNCHDYWDWWAKLEDVVRTGKSEEIHGYEPGDPHWERYIRGQWQLARVSAPEVAKGLKATVLDLPGSAAIGREIISEAGMSDRVEHVEGDAFEADLGGPYDGALMFNLIHHFEPEDNVRLFRRIHDALKPGGTFAVLDLFLPRRQRKPDSSVMLGLFFFLTSAAGTYTPEQLKEWLREAGFEEPRKVRITRIPSQTLYEARKAA